MDYSDILAQQQALDRRKKLLEALQAQSNAPIVANNWGDRIAQLVAHVGGGYLAKSRMEDADKQGAALQQQYSQGLSGATGKILDAWTGKAGVQGSPVLPDDTTPAGDPSATLEGGGQLSGNTTMQPPVAADPRAAVMMALSSRYPELQKAGQVGMDNMLKSTTKEAKPETFGHTPTTVTGPDGKPTLVMFGDQGTMKPINGAAPFKDPMAVNGQLVNPITNQPVGDFRTKATPPVMGRDIGLTGDAAGDLYQKDENGKYTKLDNAPKTTVNNHMSAPPISVSIAKGETALQEALGKDTAAQFANARKEAEAGYSTLNVVKQLRTYDKAGTFSGPTANLATSLANVAQTVGIPVDKAKLANSEAYQQQVSKQIASFVTGTAGRSITDTDRQMIEKSFPNMLQSPAGRQQIYSLLENGANTAIARHKSFQTQIEKVLPPGYAGLMGVNPVDSSPAPGVMPNVIPTVPASGNPPAGWKVIR